MRRTTASPRRQGDGVRISTAGSRYFLVVVAFITIRFFVLAMMLLVCFGLSFYGIHQTLFFE